MWPKRSLAVRNLDVEETAHPSKGLHTRLMALEINKEINHPEEQKNETDENCQEDNDNRI